VTRESARTPAPGSWARLFCARDLHAGTFYDLLGGHVLGARGDLANMGLWRGATTLEQAVEALFALVLDAARLEPGHAVVDAGSGFGTLALRCVARHGAARVVGLNLSRVQLDESRRRAVRAGLDGRVEFLHASATRMPLPDASVDRVLSVEAAFHFETRAGFLREAARVLRPGGLLVMADLLAPPPRSLLARVLLAWARRGVRMPAANVGDLATLRTQAEHAGLAVDRLESLAPDVLRPFRRWFLRQPLRELLRYAPGMMLATAPYFLCPWDYALLVVRRP
jgi:cyclopropane fatty-acyl-phospholipid synthase-like methyltransferase